MTKKLNEENIRVAAYYLWENAGRPEGMEKEFWHQAYHQLMCEPVANKCLSKTKKSGSKVSAKSCAKKSSVSASIVKTSLKPTLAAKPYYGIKK